MDSFSVVFRHTGRICNNAELFNRKSSSEQKAFLVDKAIELKISLMFLNIIQDYRSCSRILTILITFLGLWLFGGGFWSLKQVYKIDLKWVCLPFYCFEVIKTFHVRINDEIAPINSSWQILASTTLLRYRSRNVTFLIMSSAKSTYGVGHGSLFSKHVLWCWTASKPRSN